MTQPDTHVAQVYPHALPGRRPGDPKGGAAAPAQVSMRGVDMLFPRPGNADDKFHVLGPIDLELRQGEFFAVVGPSGCGKTTLLELVAGLSVATRGEVAFEGEPIVGRIPDGVGVVFQEDASFPWLTVRENIAFGLHRQRIDTAEKTRRVDRALAMMGLVPFAQSYPAQLSGGMRQRVCIARTLVTEPRLILLDEPFGALDQQTRLLMGDEVLNLWRKTGATVFLITHALDEAAMLADRIGVMSARPGRLIDIVETGWPKDRDSRIVQDERFGVITARLWRTLREESMKSIGAVDKAASA
jgi:NitT/TauT family transport system ATP-binding protein